jgi:hypothetical protein
MKDKKYLIPIDCVSGMVHLKNPSQYADIIIEGVLHKDIDRSGEFEYYLGNTRIDNLLGEVRFVSNGAAEFLEFDKLVVGSRYKLYKSHSAILGLPLYVIKNGEN